MAELNMSRGSEFFFFGSVHLEVVSGEISVLGAHLNPDNFGTLTEESKTQSPTSQHSNQNQKHKFDSKRCIWSPSFCPAVGIHCISDSATIILKKNIKFTSRPDLVSLFFSNLSPQSFSNNMPIISGFWPLDPQFPEFSKVSFDFSTFHIDDITSPLVKFLASNYTFFAGGKGAGKSTACIYKINTLLNDNPKIQLLDFDIGQPLLTVPGLMSLVEISDFILTPFPGLDQEIPWKFAWCVGDSTPKDTVDNYLDGASSLVDKLHWSYPVVINTMGWIIATGHFLLKKTHSLIIRSFLAFKSQQNSFQSFQTIFLDPYIPPAKPKELATPVTPETVDQANSAISANDQDSITPTQEQDTPVTQAPRVSRDPNSQKVKVWMSKSHYSRFQTRPSEKYVLNYHLSPKHLRAIRWLSYFGLPVHRITTSSIPSIPQTPISQQQEQLDQSESFASYASFVKLLYKDLKLSYWNSLSIPIIFTQPRSIKFNDCTIPNFQINHYWIHSKVEHWTFDPQYYARHPNFSSLYPIQLLSQLYGFPISLADGHGFCITIALFRFHKPPVRNDSQHSFFSTKSLDMPLMLYVPPSHPITSTPDSIEITNFASISTYSTTMLDIPFPTIPWFWKCLLKLLEPQTYQTAKSALQSINYQKNQALSSNGTENGNKPESSTNAKPVNANPNSTTLTNQEKVSSVRSKRNRNQDNPVALGEGLQYINTWISAINDNNWSFMYKSISKAQGAATKTFRVNK